jgi:hypothetical protein
MYRREARKLQQRSHLRVIEVEEVSPPETLPDVPPVVEDDTETGETATVSQQPDPEFEPSGKRPRGRPSKSESDRDPRVKPFPKAPKAVMKGGYVTPPKFFGYWAALPQHCLDRVMVYFYRDWPVMNYLQFLTPQELEEIKKRRKRGPQTNIAKLTEPFNPEEWKDEMLRRFGSGTYHILLNDTALQGRSVICATSMELRDDEFPPVIEDLRYLDKSDPANASYIKKLELAGVLRSEEEPVEEEKDDMAGASAEIIKDLTGRVIEMSKEGKKETPPAAAPSSPTEQASIEAIRVMGNAFSKIEEQRAKLADPDAAVDRIVKLAQTMTPAAAPNGGGNDAIINMLTKQLELAEQRRIEDRKLDESRHSREIQTIKEAHTAQLASIEQRIQMIQTTPAGGPVVSAPATSEFAILDKLLGIKDKLDALTGGGDASPIPGWVPYALQGVKIVGDVAANIMHNAAVAKLGQGSPVSPPSTSAEPAELEEGSGEQADGQFAAYARQIHPLLKDALAKGMPGYEFAARIIIQMGGNSQAYDFVIQDGVPGLMKFLQSAPEVWATMQQYGQNRQNEIFMDQFCNRENVMKAVEVLRNPPKPQRPPSRTIITDAGAVKTTGPVINTVPVKE